MKEVVLLQKEESGSHSLGDDFKYLFLKIELL
jgi:hypothetical protein